MREKLWHKVYGDKYINKIYNKSTKYLTQLLVQRKEGGEEEKEIKELVREGEEKKKKN